MTTDKTASAPPARDVKNMEDLAKEMADFIIRNPDLLGGIDILNLDFRSAAARGRCLYCRTCRRCRP